MSVGSNNKSISVMPLRNVPVHIWFLLTMVLWLVGEYVLFGKFSAIIVGDNAEYIVPDLISAKFSNNFFPIWDRYTAGGLDRLTSGEGGIISVLIFQVLPGWAAHSLMIFSQMFLAVFGSYALARKTFAFGVKASVVVALVYGLGMHPYLASSYYAFAPIIILAITCLLDNKKSVWRWVIALAAIFLISQTSFFSRLSPSSALVIAWFIFADFRKSVADWVIILFFASAIILMRFDEIKALAAIVPYSQLPLVSTPLGFLEAFGVFKIFVYGNVNLLSTASFLAALVVRKAGNFQMKMMAAGLLLGAMSVPAMVGMRNVFSEILPLLKNYSVGHISLVPVVFLAFSMGYGADIIFLRLDSKNGRGSLDWPKIALYGILATGAIILVMQSLNNKVMGLYNWVTQGSYARNFESPALEDLKKRLDQNPWPIRVEPYQVLPAYLHAYGIETAGGYSPVFPKRYFEFWAKMFDPYIPNSRRDVYDGTNFRAAKEPGGKRRFKGRRFMLYPSDYNPEVKLAVRYRMNMLSLANVGYFVSRDHLVAPQLTPVVEASSPWSSLSRIEKTRINIRENFTGREHLNIYRNRDVLPRFFTVSKVHFSKNGEENLATIAATPVDILRHTLFVSRGDAPSSLEKMTSFADRFISLVSYEDEKIHLTVSDGGESILVVLNAFTPLWKCDVDGKKAKLFPAYHAFWGLMLPQGARDVVCYYHPDYGRSGE